MIGGRRIAFMPSDNTPFAKFPFSNLRNTVKDVGFFGFCIEVAL